MPTSEVFGRQAEPQKDQRSYVKLRNGYMKTGGMVVDIFPGGIEIEMLSTSGMKFGDNVELHSDKIGYIDGMISWVKTRRLGVEFDRTSNNTAKVAAFLKNFHQG